MGKKLYIGVDLGGTSMRAGAIDNKGRLLSMEKRKTHPELGAAGVLERLVKTVSNAAKAAGVKMKDIGGIGIGVPGPIDSSKGVVRLAVNLGKDWTNYPLAKKLQAELDVPVYLDNDVRVGAMGEFTYGAGREVQDMIAVFVGTGIGGGIILDGKLRRGFRGGAGEVGHSVFDANNGIMGKTGQEGTVEPVASRTGMERMIKDLVATGRKTVVLDLMQSVGDGRLTSSVIAEALKQDDAVMKEALTTAQHALGILAGNLINILDPQMIVIGGGVTERLGEKFVAPIRHIAYANLINKADAKTVKILPAALKDASGVVGAAVLARANL